MPADRTHLRKLRYSIQFAFLLLTFFIGYRFFSFVLHFESPGHPFVQRPPSVDAFLPIAGLMSFKYFLFTGIIEPIHPAAFVMFVAIVAVSLFLKKGFCGWICPVGTVSQYFWMAGEKIFGRNLRMKKYADVPVRSLKYILMALFLVLIGLTMAPNMLVLFFLSDYYKTADVRTMKFFTEMSQTAFWSLLFIGGFSLLLKNFWCRYLCPYGALLGLLSSCSPVKIRRNEEKCVHCGACTKNCPTLLPVETKEVVSSPECFGCMTCVSHCPSKGALDITVKAGKKRMDINPWLYPAALLLLFYLIIGAGIVSGNWQSRVSITEYRELIPGISPKDGGKQFSEKKAAFPGNQNF
jgi:polyferredoxin